MAKIFTVTTGFGYFKDTLGRVCVKAELPNGEHTLSMIDEAYTYHEVADKDALDAIAIDPETQKDPNWVPSQ